MKLKVQVCVTCRANLSVLKGLGRAVRAIWTWISEVLRRWCTRTFAYGTAS